MTFIPRRLTNGKTCCSNPLALCDKCQAHHRMRFNAGFEPPDPYRAAMVLDREIHYDEHGVPDPYFAGIERMRKDQ